jgi:hypothetical protein
MEPQIDIWFKPWDYAHHSWTDDSIFDGLTEDELYGGYIPWCKYVGIEYNFSSYQSVWLEQYWINEQNLILATSLLGNMLYKQKDAIVTPTYLRWVQQTALARPIVLNVANIRFASNFEAGINLLYQVLQCYCPAIWTRFLLKFPKDKVQDIHIYDEPLIKGKMILVIEKIWNMIIKKIANS